MVLILLLTLFSLPSFAITDGVKVELGSEYEKFNATWIYKGNSYCSGVIISSKHILTAAHCVGDRLNQVRFGLSRSKYLNVKRVITHPYYQAELMSWPYPNQAVNDIAILELEENIPMEYKYLEIYSKLNEKGRLLLFGYGQESTQGSKGQLRYRELKVQDYLRESGEWVTSPAACHGDSGGPLVYITKKRVYLLGITSRADKRFDNSGCHTFSIQTDLIHQRDWIYSVIK